ncbi:MAG TPA: hypothetical protein DCS43_05985 [Verrucomicrobia bacterium]|nr:hypothetical protein [Verrucomicrobiota bacterium]
MRIAVYHNLPNGGAMRVLGEQCRLLMERGHVLECWVPVGASRHGLPSSMPIHEVPYAGGWAILHRLMPSLLDRFQKIFCATGALEAMARRAGADINAKGFGLLFSGNCRYQAAPPIGRYVDIPSVLYAHEPYRPFHEPELVMPFTRLNRACRVTSERANAAAFTRLLANSEFSRQRLQAAYGIMATVCYLGVDTERFSPTGERREAVVVGVGVVQPHKRIELAIEALACLPSDGRPPLHWIGAAGNPVYRRKLKWLARQRRVDLTFLHQVKDNELVSRLSRASLLICTARNEPFGLTPIEASACGTPVIGVGEGGFLETVIKGVNGELTEPTAEALAQAIGKLLATPQKINQLGRSARQHVLKHWSWAGSITRLESLLAATIPDGIENRHP